MALVPQNGGPSKLIAAAYMVLGVGFFLMGWNQWQALAVAAGATGIAGLGKAKGLGDGAFADVMSRKLKATQHTVRSIDQRVKLIQQLIHKSSRDPELRKLSLAIVNRKCGEEWCVPERDWKGEADALYAALTDPRSPYALRYSTEHPSVDVFAHARVTLSLRGGDCDDMTIVLASMLLALGHTVRLIVIQSVGAKDWSHIFLAVVPKVGAADGLNISAGGGWYFLDPTMRAQGPGWEPPGTSSVLKTGRPAGMVLKARAFKVD